MDLEGRSRNSVTKCPPCPFRTFRDNIRVRLHLRKYHTRERWFCASSLPNSRVAVAQLHIAKALYNQSMTLSVLHEPNTQPRYFQKAALLLFDWVATCPTEAAELQKRNEVPVVLMLCGSARSMS